MVESRGHILVVSPKCHPALAGVDIEYAGGEAIVEFRRRINDEDPKSLRANMLKALSTETVLDLGRLRRFARRTRDYRVYALLGNTGADLEKLKQQHGGAEGFKLIAKTVAKCKAHRNIVDLEVMFLNTN